MPKKHVPTRLCPHRWCRHVHMLFAAVGLVALAPLIFHSLIVFAGVAITGFIGYAVARAVRGRSLTQLSAEEVAARHGNARTPHLIVRPGWARAAIACDFVFLFSVTSLAFSVFRNPSGEADRAAAGMGDITGLIVGTAFLAFTEYAHRKATEPARPLRLPVPAISEGSA